MNWDNLRNCAGIVFEGTDSPKLALDAQQSLTTVANGGIPSLFTTYIDPKVIETALAPVRMAEIFNERKLGDITTTSAMFTRVENTGTIATYGDSNNNGMSDANVSFPERDHYYYQTLIEIGTREIEIYAKQGNLDWVARKQESAQMALNRFQNSTYIYGISGMRVYGTLNDPNLLPSLAINIQDIEGLAADVIYNQVFRPIYNQLINQTKGLINEATPMTLVLSPKMQTYMQNTNSFGNSVSDLLKKNFPNLTIEIVPEYGYDAGGERIQWLAKDFNGTETIELGFSEKLRVHAMEVKTSSYLQKRSQGSLGAVIQQPTMVSSAIVGTA